MKLSQKTLLLYAVRIFALPVLFMPLTDYFFSFSPVWLWTGYALPVIALFLCFFIRYKTCRLDITARGIRLSKGFIIRKSLYIKYRHIVATNRIYTPLSRHLKLSNPIFYCEGATFILPPIGNALAQQIEENIQSEVKKYET